jgi:hypothetical protein
MARAACEIEVDKSILSIIFEALLINNFSKCRWKDYERVVFRVLDADIEGEME